MANGIGYNRRTMGHTPSTVSTSRNPFAVNTAAKDAFARLLATENLTVVHDAAAHTASFCTQTRVLTLPVWQEMSGNLYDMLCAHEVGHALYTPADAAVVDQSHAAVDSDAGVDVGVIHDYLNVVEDIRIDRQMKDNFPGLKRCYAEAGKYLFDQDFFGVKNATPEQIASLSLLDRLNLHFKSGIYGVTDVPMTADEAAFLPRLEAAKTWEDVSLRKSTSTMVRVRLPSRRIRTVRRTAIRTVPATPAPSPRDRDRATTPRTAVAIRVTSRTAPVSSRRITTVSRVPASRILLVSRVRSATATPSPDAR